MKCPQSNCGYYMLAVDEKEEPEVLMWFISVGLAASH